MRAQKAAGPTADRTGKKALGNTQYQTAQAIPIAAQNEGGVAGIGAGLAAGMGMGNAMTAAMMGQQVAPPAQPVQAAPAVAPVAAAPAAGEDLAGKLTQLKNLLDQGLISQADYDTAKAEVIKKITG